MNPSPSKPPPADGPLGRVIAGANVATINDVITVMRGLDAALPPDDGLKWFNYLYLSVTESILQRPPAEGWEDPAWLTRLDVVFATLYFSAVAGSERPRGAVPRAWAPLFEARRRTGVQRVQFALAGMNAHINRDLPVALVQTAGELGILPERGTPQFRDFERVNTLLEQVETEVKQQLATGIFGLAAEDLGRLGDVLAMWSVRHARDTAWTNAQILWTLRALPVPKPADDFLLGLDRLVGVGSRGLLIPVDHVLQPQSEPDFSERLEITFPPIARQSGKRLYVGNLDQRVTDSDLRTLFSTQGTVEAASVVIDRDTGRSRGFGFVEMLDDRDAQAAIQALNGKEVAGRILIVNKPRPKHGPGHGGHSGGQGTFGGELVQKYGGREKRGQAGHAQGGFEEILFPGDDLDLHPPPESEPRADAPEPPASRQVNAWLEGAGLPLHVGKVYRVGVNIGGTRPDAMGGGPFREPDWGHRTQLDLLIVLSGRGARITPTSQWVVLPRQGETPAVFFNLEPLARDDEQQWDLELFLTISLARELTVLEEFRLAFPVVRIPEEAHR